MFFQAFIVSSGTDRKKIQFYNSISSTMNSSTASGEVKMYVMLCWRQQSKQDSGNGTLFSQEEIVRRTALTAYLCFSDLYIHCNISHTCHITRELHVPERYCNGFEISVLDCKFNMHVW